jgi:hypothetical protein
MNSSFFHLSPSPTAKAIVLSDDKRAEQPLLYFSPRPPEDHADEKSDPRICVAPRIWQCLVSHPQPVPPLFIYGLNCSGAKCASRHEHRVGDAEITDEHWIDEDVIRSNGGSIPLICKGVLRETNHPRHLLWDWLDELRNWPAHPRSYDEREHIWIIDGLKNPPEWDIRRCLTMNLGDDSPLIPRNLWDDEFADSSVGG